MSRIAVSGHRGLAPEVSRLVDAAIRGHLAPWAGAGCIVGLSCLADGADQIFARAVLDAGGELEVVVPAQRYRQVLPPPAQTGYDEMLAQATAVYRLTHAEPTSTAYMEASIEMLRRADGLVAVWDGLPARSLGGTADVVDYARSLGLSVTVIWPEGAARDRTG